MNAAIFKLLGIDGEFDKKALFSIKNIDNQDLCIKRLQFIMEIYSKWINFNKTIKIYHGITMHDIIEELLSPNYNKLYLMMDYQFVCCNHNVSINDKNITCDADSCLIIDRTERDREIYSQNTAKRNELYFVRNENKNNDSDGNSSNREISIQQILDTLHCWLYHTLKLNNLKKYIQKDTKKDSDNKNTNNAVDFEDIDYSCSDKFTSNIKQAIETRTRKSSRYRSSYNRDPNQSKFYTIIANEKAIEVLNGDEIDQLTITDHLINHLEFAGLDNETILAFEDYLHEHQYDTDSLLDDIERRYKSNIAKDLSSVNPLLYGHCTDILHRNLVNSNSYSPGYRYFYWDYYKDNDNATNRICKTAVGWIIEENVGYKLSEWYINQKYKNFKDELLHNSAAPFSRDQYAATLEKAKLKLDAWLKSKHTRKLICLNDQRESLNHWHKIYGIARGDSVKLDHIISLLCYTNFTKNSYQFSRSFRKVRDFESDEQLKERHREFYFWGKNIRECVECFGEMMEDTETSVFYHGINAPMIFDSTAIKLNGPLSTTASLVYFSYRNTHFLLWKTHRLYRCCGNIRIQRNCD